MSTNNRQSTNAEISLRQIAAQRIEYNAPNKASLIRFSRPSCATTVHLPKYNRESVQGNLKPQPTHGTL
jgi:hypothetical protein